MKDRIVLKHSRWWWEVANSGIKTDRKGHVKEKLQREEHRDKSGTEDNLQEERTSSPNQERKKPSRLDTSSNVVVFKKIGMRGRTHTEMACGIYIAL